MYLTAHSVSSKDGASGINSFLHLHGSGGINWYTDVSDIPETNPGHIVSQSVEIPPGGNKVQSWLDILCSDAAGQTKIIGVCVEFFKSLPNLGNPAVFSCAGVTIRFGVQFGLLDRRASEFHLLLKRAILLIADGNTAKSKILA